MYIIIILYAHEQCYSYINNNFLQCWMTFFLFNICNLCIDFYILSYFRIERFSIIIILLNSTISLIYTGIYNEKYRAILFKKNCIPTFRNSIILETLFCYFVGFKYFILLPDLYRIIYVMYFIDIMLNNKLFFCIE